MTNGFIFIEWIRKLKGRCEMSNTVLYAVIGTFVNEDNDVVLDYFDNLEDARRFESEFESEDLEFTRIYKLESEVWNESD